MHIFHKDALPVMEEAMSRTFAEGEQVLHIEEGVTGRIDLVRERLDRDTDRPIGEPSYDVEWNDGNYSTHLESELVSLSEG